MSTDSNIVTLLCAFKPAVPSAPQTSVIGNQVIVEWNAPDTNGSPITSYRIKLQQKNGSFSEELTYCNGTNAALVTSRKCTIPLLILQAPVFILELGDSIVATVTATNVYGESEPSTQGNGAIMLTVPYKPLGLATNITNNTKSVISLTW